MQDGQLDKPLTDQQKRFRLLSHETRDIIQKSIDTLTSEVMESVYAQLCEEDSPNSPDFWNNQENMLELANEYIIATLEGEADE